MTYEALAMTNVVLCFTSSIVVLDVYCLELLILLFNVVRNAREGTPVTMYFIWVQYLATFPPGSNAVDCLVLNLGLSAF